MNYVIIGNSTAAIGCIEGIRRQDQTGTITVISKESYHTYSRPLISYYLQGKVSDLQYRPKDFYEKHDARLLEDAVTGIDPKGKKISTAKGLSLPYDKLLLATGSMPSIPTYQGLESVPYKYTFTSFEDALALEKQLDDSKRVLILGAGLVGLKCAEGILGRVHSVTVLVRSPKILSAILDADGAKLVQVHLEKQGVAFKMEDDVKEFNGNTAITEKGETIAFDILILAKGAKPNVSLLEGIAEIEQGVLVDETCQTSVTDIYAAGDCTQALDYSSGRLKVMALLPNAYMQGECAGTNMAGKKFALNKIIPMNAVGFFGKHIMTAGTLKGESHGALENENYKNLFFDDHKLKGFILVGDVDDAGIYTNLIRNGLSLEYIDMDAICKAPSLLAFGQEARQELLGGVPAW